MSIIIQAGFSNPPTDGSDTTQKMVYIFGTLSFSGNYTAGGDTLDFTTIFDLVKTDYQPIRVMVEASSGYLFAFVQGGSFNNGKLKVWFPPGSGGLELNGTSYAAQASDLVADKNVFFTAVFVRN